MNKNCLKYSSDQRLDEEQLAKQSKEKVKADQFDPVGKECQHMESRIKRIIEKCGKKAHRRTHKGDGSTDDCGLKENRMRFLRIKILHGQLHRTGASHADLQGISQNELDHNYHPNWAIATQHIHTTQPINGSKDAVCPGERQKRPAVDYIEAVKT